MKRQLFILLFLLIALGQSLYAQTVNSGLTADDWDAKARKKYYRKDFRGAISDFDKAIALDAKNGSAYLWRAEAKADLGLYAEAIIDYNHSIALYPKDYVGHYDLALAQISLGRCREAIESLDTVIFMTSIYPRVFVYSSDGGGSQEVVDPKDPNGYNVRGYAYYKLGNTKANYQKAIKDYDTSIRLGGSDYKPVFKYRNNSVAAMAKAVGQLYTADDWEKLGVQNSKDGNDVEAIADCEMALGLNPKLAMAYVNIGLAKSHLGSLLSPYNSYKYAPIVDFDAAIALDPNLAIAYCYRGRIYAGDEGGGDYRALKDFNRAIELDPQLSIAYVYRGDLRNSSWSFESAIADYNRAISLDPQTPDSYNGRGYAYYNLGRTKSNYEKAVADYDMAFQIGGTNYKPKYQYRDYAVRFMGNVSSQ